MKWFSNKLFYTIGVAMLCSTISAQSLDQAKKMYNEGKYAEAMPAFEKLVRQVPGNPSYNLWYGVCCYETGDIATAEKHLNTAYKHKDLNACRYLADIYFKTYRFDESVAMYDEYIEQLTKKKQETAEWEAKQEISKTCQRMVDKVEDVQIIDSIVVDKDHFLSAYTLSNEAGSLMPFKEFFGTNEDINSIVYKNQKGNKIYYAHSSGDNHYCLFTQSLLMGKWGDEKQLPMTINSKEDDNYPYVLSDGVTIYYASKANGSIGGYDLFVTRYNINSDTYLTPEQLGMPFNSIYNDYMIVYDEMKNLGWFVSDRFQPEGKACVYLFIPNSNNSRIESDDMSMKRARAEITSIKDSWKPGANYADLVRLAHTQSTSGEKKIQKDFEFMLGNGVTYYTLHEFKSPEARNIYEKYIAVNKQIKEMESKLDNLRTSYSKAAQGSREQLKTTILKAERELYNLYGQPESLEKDARNAEINYLNNKR